MSLWGTGMYPAQGGACPFNFSTNDEIQGIKTEQEEIKKEAKDLKDDLHRARTRAKQANRALANVKSRFQKHGLTGGAYNIIDRHISSGRSCDNYATVDCPASRGGRSEYKMDPVEELLALNGIVRAQPKRNVASTNVPPGEIEDEAWEDVAQPPPRNSPPPPPGDGSSVPDGQGEIDCAGRRSSTSPFPTDVWNQACSGSSISGSFICRQGIDQGPNFNDRLCERLLSDWLQEKKDADDAEAKVGELEAELASLDIEKADKQQEYKDAVKEAREEYRRTLTEGGCIECMMQSQSYYQQQRRPNWLEVGGNLLLGVGAMYFGQQQQRYISENNAKLGFPSQSYPSIGYGYPFFMNALYGAVGGGMGSGAFGCGGGMGGAGDAFGYPKGMMAGPMGGGLYNGGFGPGALEYGPGGYMIGGGGIGGAFGYPPSMMAGPIGSGMLNGGFNTAATGYSPFGGGDMRFMNPMTLQLQAQLSENSVPRNRIATGLAMEIQTLQLRLQQAQMNLSSGGYLGFDAGAGLGMRYGGGLVGGGATLPFSNRQAPLGFPPYGSPPNFR